MPLISEAQWLRFKEPPRLLNYLRQFHSASRTKDGRRKLRLFACACCRTILWEMDVPPSYRRFVEAAEGFADGAIDETQLEARRPAAKDMPSGKRRLVAIPMRSCGHPQPHEAAKNSAAEALRLFGSDAVSQRPWKIHQCNLLRDIFGNPFRPPTRETRWLTSTSTSIAQAIYADRAFDRLPILGDALEEAGCTDPEVLAHCRGPGPHVRGCWVVDLLLAAKRK